MDETPVWADMVTGTAVESRDAKDVPLKIPGHENVRVTVCLTTKADGRKVKPFIVFVAEKWESKTLHDEFKSLCSIASFGNSWVNEELNLRWGNEVLGNFS